MFNRAVEHSTAQRIYRHLRLQSKFESTSSINRGGLRKKNLNKKDNSAPHDKRAVRSHSTACDDGTFRYPKESRRALSRSD